MRQHEKPRGAWAQPDRLIAAGLLVTTFLILLPYLQYHFPTWKLPHGGQYHYDEGTFLYHCQRIARGHVLHKDFFDFKGIVAYLPFALTYLFAPAGIVAGRITMFVIIAATTAATYTAGMLVTQRRLVALCAALFIPLLAWPNWPVAYHDFTAQLWLVLALIGALKAMRGSARLWFASGAAAGLALWTTLAQGSVGAITLGAAAVLVMLGRGDRRGAWIAARNYAGGIAAVSALFVAYFATRGAVPHMVRAMFLFPFTHYGAANATTYGQDAPRWIAAWETVSAPTATALRVMSRAVMDVPRTAVVLGLAVGAMAIVRAVRGVLAGSRSDHAASSPLEPLTLVFALTAVELPVVLNKTRSDMCHIGFVAPVAALALACLCIRPVSGQGPRIGRAVTIAQSTLLAAFVVILGSGLFFQLRNIRSKYQHRGFVRMDAYARADFGVDADSRRTVPGDWVVHLPSGYHPGGFHYLLSGRDNATSFTILENDGKYYEEQWPQAAKEIVERRPRLMRVTSGDLNLLARHRPEIRTMYFGVSGDYILADRRPGPPFQDDKLWALTVEPAKGPAPEPTTFTITSEGAKLLCRQERADGNPADLLGSIDGDRFTLLWGNRRFVGILSADGRRVEGNVYPGQPPLKPARFVLERRD